MGRDRMRVLVCAFASVALIIAGALVMDWYQLSFEAVTGATAEISVDLRRVHACHLGPGCVSAPLAPLPGMFPTLAAVTMWSSLGVAGLVLFQAGARILTGNANDSLTKLGYMISLMAISIAIATAYMFGPENEGPMIGVAAEAGVVLHRTWAPLMLISGLIAGFATLYIAVAPESSDLTAAYKPVTLAPARAVADMRTRTPSVRIPFPEHTGTFPILGREIAGTPTPDERAGAMPNPIRARPATAPPPTGESTAPAVYLARERPTTDLRPPRERPSTGPQPVRERAATGPLTARERTVTGLPPIRERTATGLQPVQARTTTGVHPVQARTTTGVHPVQARTTTPPYPSRERTASGTQPAQARPTTGVHAIRELPATGTRVGERTATGLTAPGSPVSRTKSGPIIPIPEHLRNRLAYVAITAELTGGGIDARREDGSSRLVLWRDVVGVVARRMPAEYDGATFIDVVSTAGSTLRIVPWTRLTGEPIPAEGDERPRRVVERVVARCPAAKLDPATRHFLETGEPAQLPDLETLRAHDQRLA